MANISGKNGESTGDGAKERPAVKPEDVLYAKNYVCPVCDKTFQSSTVRVGKNKLLGTDTDLRPNCETVDSVFYDVVHCNNCGYTAMERFFDKILDKQSDSIKANITANYRSRTYPLVLTANLALERYKLAFISAVHKNAKHGEKAYLYLKMGWIYRGMKDWANERKCLENAFEGFKHAYGTESFPICGMEEPTLNYLLGDLARRLGFLDEATRFLSSVITSRSASSSLKDKARVVKDLVAAAKAAKQE